MSNANQGRTGVIYTVPFASVKFFIAGWLTAYNAMVSDTFDIVPNGLDGTTLWLNNYCNNNPLKQLEDGLRALVEEAYPSRQRSAQ
jgi:hypothetical protein